MKRIHLFYFVYFTLLITLLTGCNQGSYYDTSEDRINSCELESEEQWIYGLWEQSDDKSQLLYTPDGMKSSDLHKWLWHEFFGIQTTLDIRDTELYPYSIWGEEGHTFIQTPGGMLDNFSIEVEWDNKKITNESEREPFKKKNSKIVYRNGDKSIGEQFEGLWVRDNNMYGKRDVLKKIKYIQIEDGIMTILDRRVDILGESPITTFKDKDEDGLKYYVMGLFYTEIHEYWIDNYSFDCAVALRKESFSNSIDLYEDGVCIGVFNKMSDESAPQENNVNDDEALTNKIIAKGTFETNKIDYDPAIYLTTGEKVYVNYVHSYTFKSGGRGTSRFYENNIGGRKLLNEQSFTWSVSNGRLQIRDEDGTFKFKIVGNGEKIVESGGDVYD